VSVCNKENVRIYHTDCVGIVEDHYHCSKCGYFRETTYSPVTEGVDIPEGIDKITHNILYGARIKQKKIKIYPSSILECF
jgi:hypothetical protein